MRKLFTFAAIVFSCFIVSTGYAGSFDTAASNTGNIQAKKAKKSVGDGPVIEEKSAFSVKEQYRKRVDNKKRAMKMRNKLIRESQQQKAR